MAELASTAPIHDVQHSAGEAEMNQAEAGAGADRIGIGVFEFNERALCCFTSLGYDAFLRRPDPVWWGGRMWSDIRLLKTPRPLPSLMEKPHV